MTISDAQVEAAALALWESELGDFGRTGEWAESFADADEAVQERFRSSARAALDAAARVAEPTDALDSVLAEIEAMGWDVLSVAQYGRGWSAVAVIGSDETERGKSGKGATRLAAALALRTAIRRTTEGTP